MVKYVFMEVLLFKLSLQTLNWTLMMTLLFLLLQQTARQRRF